MSLKTGRSRHTIRKSVRVESNDPLRRTTTLSVTATIKIDVGVEDITINMGNVLSQSRTVKDVYVELEDQKNVVVSDITSSSDFISAEEIRPADTTAPRDSLHFQITIEPGLKPGLLSDDVVVGFKDDVRPRLKLYMYGIIVDEIEVTPLRLNYIVSGEVLDTANQTRKLTVINYVDSLPLEIIDVNTPGKQLDFNVSPVDPGKKYEIMATANDKIMAVDSTLDSRIVITTNNPNMRLIKIPFTVVRK